MRNFSATSSPRESITKEQAQALVDAFIHKHTPQWIKAASAQDIARLRTLIAQHKASQDKLAEATKAVQPVHAFALHTYSEALQATLPAGHDLTALEWRDKVLETVGVTTPHADFVFKTKPGLLRLMQNFAANATPLDGSGLYAPGSETLLSGNVDEVCRLCRELDAGLQYQTLLDKHFEASKALLIDDKRKGFELAVHMALLRQHIDGDVAAALNALTSTVATHDVKLVAYPGLMSMLGHTVHEALFIQLRSAQDEDAGVVIYRPAEAQAPLRWYSSKLAFEVALLEQLKDPGYLASLLQSVGLATRKQFLQTLQLRLKDTAPDLAVEGEGEYGSVFDRWVLSQLERAKDDARLLLVPTAEVDAQASRERVDAWVSAGWTLVNLGGFFIPTVGALLLAQLVAQVCSQVFAGVADWAKGHDHEALRHLLDVAQTVAAAAVTTGAVVGGTAVVRKFTRSAFVDSLDVVDLEDGTARLWHEDLSVYASAVQDAALNERGLYSKGDDQWLRIDDRFYQVRRTGADGKWRLVHPLRKDAYGPVVRYNGERYWHLPGEHPQTWNDAAKMLGRLWPQQMPLDQLRAQQLLLAAGSDIDELRGILVQNQALPANLRDTLRRFEADQRIEQFFASLQPAATVQTDPELLQWCRQHSAVAGMDNAQALAEIVERAAQLRFELFRHLTEGQASDDRVVQVILRDFAGLPEDYAQQLAGSVSVEQRDHIELLQRLPLAVAEQARALLQLARLNRARQGLWLRNGYSDESGELILSLLARLANWPFNRRLELRAGSSSGRLLSVLNPAGPEATGVVITRINGQFRLYDKQGHALDVELGAPDDVFCALGALLTPAQRLRLNLPDQDPAAALRARVASTMPADRQALLNVLGWREGTRWFNPGQRLADGRVGYPLGGAQSTERDLTQRMRARLGVLYRGDSQARINQHLDRIVDCDDPFEALIFEEANFQLLCNCLDIWIAQAREAEKQARRLLAARLRQAWRSQLPVDYQRQDIDSRILDLSGFQVTSLPELAEGIDFHFVTTMVMVNTPLASIPEAFFSCFGAVRRLNFSRNQLRVVPIGLRHLRSLDNLQLSYNRIRMDSWGQDAIRNLPQLTSLDLSVNPLGSLALDFTQVPALRYLSLRHCGLVNWPAGLEHCGMLNMADLRNNQLANVPEAAMNMPYAFRSALRMDGNAIPQAQWARLHRLPAHVDHALQGASDSPAAIPARELWVSGVRKVEVAGYWDRLFASEDNDRYKLRQILFQLQGTQDYQRHREQLTHQVWGLLEYMDKDPQLTNEILLIARNPTACPDSIAERFSHMYLHALKSHAMHAADSESTSVLKLGLGLFRLSRLEEYINALDRERKFPDLVETRLFFNLALAKEFELPGQPASMRFVEWAHVSPDDIEAARAYVKAADTIEARAQFLGTEPYWCNWLEQQHSQDFQQISELWSEKGEALFDQKGTMSAEAYQEQWDEVEHGLVVDRQRLIMRFTKEVLEASITASPKPGASSAD
ncbi:hypothetical protein IAE39_002912 [Pseudomonas sp. S37]|uniref:NEL-type E3 ubiquitin ligase domain-containing protein n=1 Tax=Pseudomonas sp. S37 TaxID=2767449 RepID=UPI001912219F|nr:NEL-type E3 ubiquitin ligase domain-containing protein [Pseudomonas sp. S37]MBK4994738.1 hypothetical protein [Pseudomonas sp. S37]